MVDLQTDASACQVQTTLHLPRYVHALYTPNLIQSQPSMHISSNETCLSFSTIISHAYGSHVGRVFSGVCLSVCLSVPHDVSKTDAVRAIKRDREVSHHNSENSFTLGSKGQRSRSGSWRSCEYWLLLVILLLILQLLIPLSALSAVVCILTTAIAFFVSTE